MSQESTTPDLAELTRQFGEAFARRDFDAVMGSFAPGAIWDASQPGAGTFEGPAAIRAFLEDWIAAYEEWDNQWEEVRALGNGIVFSVNRQDGRLAGGEGKVQERYALTVRFGSAGLIDGVVIVQDIDEARAAAERLAAERG
jgi:ketosteroid isomerase-like protein